MYAWEQIQKTIEYIEENLAEAVSIEELSGIAALSPFYYQRLFSRLVKKPVGEYIRLRRMAKATEALLDKKKRILDVAIELGFSSHEHFSRTFKDTFGMTPDEFRTSPKALNRMTKPELMLGYTLVDEGVPLIAGDIIIEINRQKLNSAVNFIGMEKNMPTEFMTGLGTESGEDPLDTLWNEFHAAKVSVLGLPESAGELGVAYVCAEKGYFTYFAGAEAEAQKKAEGFSGWVLPEGEYIVCTFEAENFDALVMDALYKAEQYLYNVWLPSHKIRTEPFCAERYQSHAPSTTSMQLWLKLAKAQEN